ncbi:MAG: TIGR04283 family arsenosugar biosynthesis glycosyltransferase [Planctomycetota bacterium]
MPEPARTSAKRPRLSVVIPTFDEAARLPATLDRLRRCAGDTAYEVIVADGGSTDATAALARAGGAALVRSPRGRGPQMNAGAAAAAGDTLLFLHADTRPPEDFVTQIAAVLTRPGTAAGAFRLRIDGTSWRYRLIEWAVQQRSRWRGLPYGDQGLFVSAATFRRVGGFPDWPLLEDVDLVRRLGRVGRVRLADASVATSDRGWAGRGPWRTTAVNQCCLLAYRCGVSPRAIARWRRWCLGVSPHTASAHAVSHTGLPCPAHPPPA